MHLHDCEQKKKIQEKLQTQRNKNNSKEIQKYRKKYGFLYFFRFCKTKKSYNFTIKQLVTCKKTPIPTRGTNKLKKV